MSTPRKFTLAIGVFRRDKYVLLADGKAVIQIADGEVAEIREMVAPGLLEAAKVIISESFYGHSTGYQHVNQSAVETLRKAIAATEAVKP